MIHPGEAGGFSPFVAVAAGALGASAAEHRVLLAIRVNTVNVNFVEFITFS
ncbi:hypothetical protein PLANPX_1884 [Lacipirellula parvula]|uniref:Uncharacterized protein n=1 Tax=Lacipirellula parvula TaxID=2650471 RepID=A0A5K7X8R6_9BACT|nr:hypothetical protein PLANPX_1884 [Lacipirellula parvula]